MVREIEAIGGSAKASASREQMGYTYDALKLYTPQMVEVLIDSVKNAVVLDWGKRMLKHSYFTVRSSLVNFHFTITA